MPMNRSLYPADWETIAAAVKSAAGWKCQVCGKQCRKPGEPFDTHIRTLTVSHLNHEPQDVHEVRVDARWDYKACIEEVYEMIDFVSREGTRQEEAAKAMNEEVTEW